LLQTLEQAIEARIVLIGARRLRRPRDQQHDEACGDRRQLALLHGTSPPTFPICRLLNADDMPFRRARQGFEGSSPPLTPRRTASSRSRPGFEPFSPRSFAA
jgi:hypothetical protein